MNTSLTTIKQASSNRLFYGAMAAAALGFVGGVAINAAAWLSLLRFFGEQATSAEVARAQLMTLVAVAVTIGPAWWFGSVARKPWQRYLMAVPIVLVVLLAVPVFFTT